MMYDTCHIAVEDNLLKKRTQRKEGGALAFFLSVVVKQACICRANTSRKYAALAHFEKLPDSR